MAESIEEVRRAFSAYRVEHELGRGGMASVYLAHDAKHDRKVAIKILHEELAAVLGIQRFLQEIRVTAKLQHPHILGLIDSGVIDERCGDLSGRPYYVMPYLDGESLQDRLDREQQLPVSDAIRIATEVASALDYAHRHDVIHRDIKPGNILLHDGSAIVADFGIALAIKQAGDSRLTQSGLSLGTPLYMSPEQALGERAITGRSDIFSLGAVTYEMLAGEPPFAGTTPQAVVARVVNEDPRPLSAQRPTVPIHIQAAVSRALQKLPADRFSSAHEFAAALTTPTFAVPERYPRGGLRGWRRRPLCLAAGSAVLFLGTTLWEWRKPELPRPVIRYNLQLDSNEAMAGPGVPYARFALSGDGSRLAYLAQPNTQVLVRPRNQLHATRIPGSEGASTAFFSPDGEQIGFVKYPRLEIGSADGGNPFVVTDSLVGTAGASWGTDGFIYADGEGYLPLIRVEAKAGAVPKRFTELDTASGEINHSWPEVLPNGKGVLFTVTFKGKATDRNTAHFAIAVADISSGKHQLLLRDALYPRYARSGQLLYATPDGTLMMVPFDENAMKVTGQPTAVVAGIHVGGIGSADFAISDGGTLIYATSAVQNKHDLVWVARDGKWRAADPAWQDNFWYPTLSPDGSTLLVCILGPQGTFDVWSKRLKGGPPTRLTFGGSTNWFPAWTPDGRSVTYNSNINGSFALWIKRVDSMSVPSMLFKEKRGDLHPVWSPDGNWLVFQTDVTTPGAGDIAGIRPGLDTVPVPLVATAASEIAPVLSPDGRWLAYASDESGRYEIYVVPFPRTTAGKWMISSAGGTEPVWSHRGNEIFYRDGADSLVAVSVKTSPTFALGSSNILFSATPYRSYLYGAEYAVSVDDRRFLMIRPVASNSSDKLTVVENWFDDLKTNGR